MYGADASHPVEPARLLVFGLFPNDDDTITCLFCGRPECDLAYKHRNHTATLWSGVHEQCLDKPRHNAIPESKAREFASRIVE